MGTTTATKQCCGTCFFGFPPDNDFDGDTDRYCWCAHWGNIKRKDSRCNSYPEDGASLSPWPSHCYPGEKRVIPFAIRDEAHRLIQIQYPDIPLWTWAHVYEQMPYGSKPRIPPADVRAALKEAEARVNNYESDEDMAARMDEQERAYRA